MRTTSVLSKVAAIAGLLTLALAGTAYADTNIGNTSTLAVLGSNATQDVMEGISQVITVDGAPALSNYQVRPPQGSTVLTRTGNNACNFFLPYDSRTGVEALATSLRHAAQPGAGSGQSSDSYGCVNVARSTNTNNPSRSPGVGTMTYIPFAVDAVTYAVFRGTGRRPAGAVPKVLNLSALTAIYAANGTPGSADCLSYKPLLPARPSELRTFLGQVLGLTDGAPGTAGAFGSCVRDVSEAGQPIQENDGRVLTDAQQVLPYSVAQYKAQRRGVRVTDIRGNAVLGSIDFTNSGGANALNPSDVAHYGTATHVLYNVVETAQTANGSLTQQVFAGPKSLVCKQSTVIRAYGFAVAANCGTTTVSNTN